MKKHVINANNKSLGEVASQAAHFLMGKDDPNFAPNVVADCQVLVENASKLRLSARKLDEEYTRYTGYPSGLRRETRGHLIERRGYEEVVKRAVKGMLPKNKLAPLMLKRLMVTE